MSASRQTILRRLRPPSLKPVRIVYPYQREAPPNFGYTLAVSSSDPIVAPGDGTIQWIKSSASGWRYRVGSNQRSLAVKIDHGSGVVTYIAGLSSTAAIGGNVTRGQVLGYSAAGEIFFAIELEKTMTNPAAINDFFVPRDGQIFYEQPNFIGQAPTVIRQVVTTVRELLYSGLNYFIPATPELTLFNIAFNGAGDKVGRAATGASDEDYWNVYDPVEFFITGYACSYTFYYSAFYTSFGRYFNLPILVPLLDYRQRNRKVFLERVPPLSAVAGVGVSWDTMMSRWIGGYSGPTPFVNTFRLRGLPQGNYSLFLYSEQGTSPQVSYFQVTVGASTQTGNTNPTGATSFLLDDNYVEFGVSLGYRSVIEITASGYLSGLQIRRNVIL